jgi:hypothetical protein
MKLNITLVNGSTTQFKELSVGISPEQLKSWPFK